MTTIQELTDSHPFLKQKLANAPEVAKALEHLLSEGFSGIFDKYLKQAGEKEWDRFLREITRLDFEHLARHRQALADFRAGRLGEILTKDDLEPVNADPDQNDFAQQDRERGEVSLRQGKWAIGVFAGGSGTRFFTEWDRIGESTPIKSERLSKSPPDRYNPKGLFPITVVEGLSFYQLLMAQILESGIEYGRLGLPLFMTSSNTFTNTVLWLEGDKLWGFPRSGAVIFKQGEIPRLDEDGDLIVSSEGGLFWTGDGHGGFYHALARNLGETSIKARLAERGIEHVVMGNVDNAALNPLAPQRLGFHLRKKNQFTLSVVTRTDPTEKVGMACRRKKDRRVEVIEYSVLDPALSAEKNEQGDLLFDAAHINTNLLSLEALRTDLPGTLYTNKPIQLEEKTIQSSTYEFLNQHLTAKLDPDGVEVYADERDHIFVPTKAIVGRDSITTSFQALARQGARCIEQLGGEVAGASSEPKAYVELHPCLGMTQEALTTRGVGKDWKLEEGSRLYLCLRHGLDERTPPLSAGLHLEEGATLIVRANKPYGEIEYDEDTRDISEQALSAAKVWIGGNVTIAKGVRVEVNILDDGQFIISENARIEQNQMFTVSGGGTKQL